jgi:hypothetical protein
VPEEIRNSKMIDGLSAAQVAPLSSIATAMLFGTLTFATIALATRTWLTGDSRAILAAMHPKSQPLDMSSFTSLYSLLHHFTVFGLILFFAYICEYHPPFPHAEKNYDRDEFFFLTALIIIISCYTVHKNDSSGNSGNIKGNYSSNGNTASSLSLENKLQTISEGLSSSSSGNGNTSIAMGSGIGSASGLKTREIGDDSTFTSYTTGMNTKASFIQAAPTKACNDLLNRDQTEEWKGWMQFVFLLYHYYHAEEVYNSIRIMITCYVWMTGFGNFSFFYLKADYSLIRVLQMLWRLNFLVLFLCLSQGTTYLLYYICPLHTYFFFMVYFTMAVGKHLNYTKYGLRLKLGIVALIIYLIWDVDSGFFRMLHFPFLGTQPQLGGSNGGMWEWYFRTTLDHWSTFLGMIFAANFPITSLFLRKLEALPPTKCWLAKGVIGLALASVFLIWVSGPFLQEKTVYNATNSYFGFIPLITYIYFRNLTPTLRNYSLKLLHEIGKTTLETYLMQHHIWLTSNAKSLLTLIPGWPKVNMLIVTLIYFFVSRRLYKLTLYLRGMLLPDDKKRCFISLGFMGAAIAIFYIVAFLLDNFGFTSLSAVAIISMICGMLLYQTVMDYTWDKYQSSSKESKDDDSFAMNSVFSKDKLNADSSVARLSPPIIGAMVILIVGISWQGMALAGAGKIGPLHAGCDTLANKGHWIPIDGCNEDVLGAAQRNHGISNFATCNPAGGAFTWGWETSPSSTHCRFVQRSEKQLLKSLRDQRIAFVGDSMTRNLFHAFCRQLGIKDAGQFDATVPKHQDIARSMKETGIEFKWAPLARNQLEIVKEISENVQQQDINKFDLVVVGGGAWDRLHLYATDEDKESLEQTLAELKKELVSLQQYDVPVVWTTPTTISTTALNTPEKRDNMTEEDMADMRSVYEKAGILSSSSFVVDGPAFSKERVVESFDGVHYPHDVYDAGSQILANALDWLLPVKEVSVPFSAPEPGKMANPFLGLMMLCLAFIGLMFFDGFFGFSYLAGIFVKGVLPSDLYLEAFTILHEKSKLPPINASSSASVGSFNTLFSSSSKKSNNSTFSKQSSLGSATRRRSPGKDKETSVDDEIAALLGGQNETEMKNLK